MNEIALHLIVIGAVGVSLGIVIAHSRIPRLRWAPLAASTVLTLVAVVVLFSWSSSSLVGASVLILAVLLSSTLSAGFLWKRIALEPNVAFWSSARRDFTNPGYLRQLYLAQRHDDEQWRVLGSRKIEH